MSQGRGLGKKHKNSVTLIAVLPLFAMVTTACGTAELSDALTENPLSKLPALPAGNVAGLSEKISKATLRSFQIADALEPAALEQYKKTVTDVPFGFVWEAKERPLQLVSESVSDYVLKYQGIPVVGTQLKTLSLNSNNTLTWANASIPTFLESGEATATTRFSLSAQQAVERAAAELNFHPWRFRGPKQVYFPAGNLLKAVYEVTVSSAAGEPGRGPALPLIVRIDAETGSVIEQKPIAFHAAGFATMFNENKIASASEGKRLISLPNLAGNGTYLSSELYSVVNCQKGEPSSACTHTAQGNNGDFTSISYDSPQYDELVAYHAISRSVEWHKNMFGLAVDSIGQNDAGIGWGNSRSSLGLSSTNYLTVYVRAKTRSQAGDVILDNAQYLPSGATGEGKPEILIGTGWEEDQGEPRTLRYLGKDADVTMHEFGHHVVYRSIKETSSESGAMHEGFSDYFAYAITGNNKLAETIVRGDSPLREGSLNGTVARYIGVSPHKAGQFWSSALWEVRVALGTSANGLYKADRIVWDSIDFLKFNADYYEAIAGMAKAADLYAAKYGDDATALKETMFKIFAERAFIENPDGSGRLPAKSSLLSSGATESETTTEVKKEENKSWCGVVAGTNSNRSVTPWLFVGLFAPLIFRKRKKSSLSK